MMNWVLESMEKAPSFQHYHGHIDNIIRNGLYESNLKY